MPQRNRRTKVLSCADVSRKQKKIKVEGETITSPSQIRDYQIGFAMESRSQLNYRGRQSVISRYNLT